MSVTDGTQELVDKLCEFYRNYYRDEIGVLAQQFPKDKKSLIVDWRDIFQWDADVAQDYLETPDLMNQYFHEALTLFDLPADIDLSDANVRVHNLPDGDTYNVDETRSEHIGKFLSITGQVAKRTGVQPAIDEAAFECQRCGTMTYIPQTQHDFQEPHQCQGCERQGPFRISHDQSVWSDRVKARVRQPPEQTSGGNGQHIDVYLEDDLVTSFDAGDRVTLSGEFLVREPDNGTSFDTYLNTESVVVEETDYEEIDITPEVEQTIKRIAWGKEGDPYELLVDSLAPKHRGDEHIKKALLLQMFGGVRVEYPDGSIDRGDSHVLLLGDPGCGKSSLLRIVEEMAPRSTYASGKGASAAGLTASVTSDDFDDGFSLEAGALVLANKGVACVDEIDKVHEDAVSSLHDALESQRVNIINATLPAQTSMLAAGNPKHGRFDIHEPIGEQIAIGPTLLSRFDLIFTMTDRPGENPSEEEEITRHMVESRRRASQWNRDPHSMEEGSMDDVEPDIEADTLRAYIAYAKQEVHPVIKDDDVQERLVEFFNGIRMSADEEGPVPITRRKLEAIERLAEASARIRLSDEVEMQDVERAAGLVQQSIRDVGIDPDTGEIDADIVETGKSKSQRDRIKTLKAIIREASRNFDEHDGAPMDDVIALAEEEGIGEETARKQIDNFAEKGDVYFPGKDGVALVKGGR